MITKQKAKEENQQKTTNVDEERRTVSGPNPVRWAAGAVHTRTKYASRRGAWMNSDDWRRMKPSWMQNQSIPGWCGVERMKEMKLLRLLSNLKSKARWVQSRSIDCMPNSITLALIHVDWTGNVKSFLLSLHFYCYYYCHYCPTASHLESMRLTSMQNYYDVARLVQATMGHPHGQQQQQQRDNTTLLRRSETASILRSRQHRSSGGL